MKHKTIRTVIIILSLFVWSGYIFAQNNPEQKIKVIKDNLNLQINKTGGNTADSLSRICAVNYQKALDSVLRIYSANKKASNALVAQWKTGANSGSMLQDRNLLIASILNTPDSVLLSNLQKCDLVTYIPPRQTECCAIPGQFAYDSLKTKNLDPLVLAALSINARFQNHRNYGSGIESALLYAIGVEMVNKGLLYATANGYSKLLAKDPGSGSDSTNKAATINNKKASAQPIWLWLSGGFLLAVILYFILSRRK